MQLLKGELSIYLLDGIDLSIVFNRKPSIARISVPHYLLLNILNSAINLVCYLFSAIAFCDITEFQLSDFASVHNIIEISRSYNQWNKLRGWAEFREKNSYTLYCFHIKCVDCCL